MPDRIQTNRLDGYDWPRSVQGLEAPLAVWEYCMSLMRQVERYRVALQDVQGIALNGSPTTGDDDSPWLRLDAIDVRVIKEKL